MVLQQKQDILIFGKASAGEHIVGTFNGQEEKTKAQKDGSWSLVFMPTEAGGPYKLKLKGNNEINLSNIYVGEVWFCSGQSNMGWKIENSTGGKQALRDANYDKIKLFNVRRSMSGLPTQDLHTKNKWEACTPQDTKGFSAVAYYFGRELYKKYNVPIGLIHSSWGGSRIEAWMSADAFKNDKSKQQLLAKIQNSDLNKMLRDYKNVERNYKAYLDEIDLGTQENWQSLTTDYKPWDEMQLPQVWGRTPLKQRFGIVWVTKTINLSAQNITEDVVVNLGRIDNEDKTYFNGEFIGENKKTDLVRTYTVHKELLNTGINRITVRIKNPRDNGGFRSSASDLYYKTPLGKKSLAGIWNYKVGTPNVKTPPDRVHPKYLPSSLYNAMLYPFFKYKVRGVIWYQGESNMSKPVEYAELFPKMIQDYRKQWNNPEMPFLYVQLPNIAKKSGRLPIFRAAQNEALVLDHVGMVPTIDIGEDYNIHPKNKLDVGKRLALAAENMIYKPTEKAAYPKVKNIKVENNRLLISFDENISIKGSKSKITGFEISNAKDEFFEVIAKQIDDSSLSINTLQINNPQNIRYLWEDAPKKVMIYNSNNVPLPPFSKNLN